MTRKELIVKARNIYEGCALDMVEAEMDWQMSAEFVADRLYDNNSKSDYDYYQIALEALKDYF